jgi:acetyl-CoA C-acetyltransferase
MSTCMNKILFNKEEKYNHMEKKDKRDPIIVSAVRSPVGSFGGALRDVLHVDLAAQVMKSVCERVNFPKEKLDDVFWGVVMQRGDENSLARDAELKSGIPYTTPVVQVSRACCSSMEAMRMASMRIRLNEAEAILAGGGESMSNVGYSIYGARWGLRLQHKVLSDGVWDGLSDHTLNVLMGETAENVAEEYHISRQEQDELAYSSQMRAKKAIETGRFKDEIVPISIPQRKGRPDKMVDTDEHPKSDTTMEGLAKLPAAFREGGTVTAGNSSGINDGASASIIVSREFADQYDFKMRWKILGCVSVGVDPRIMGIGPIPAVKKLLQQTGYSVKDIELWEINEAFAAPSCAVQKELGLNRDIVSVNGSGIAIGHPIGNTGCRLVVTLIHEMTKRGNKLGIATLCGGGGVGQAIMIRKDE